jgi:adenosylcobinamide-GDP ribazoletransferase
MIAQWRLSSAALRFVPLVGIVVGLVGAAAYWLAAQLWPTNVAVVLSMLASLLAESVAWAAEPDAQRGGLSGLYWVFVLLVEYNVLMALSSANVPFSLPEFLPLGLILVAGHAASGAMAASVMATHGPSPLRAASIDLSMALVSGLAPAALLGIPGLAGLVSAIGMRLVLGGRVLSRLKSGFRDQLEVTQRVTAISFYLGALATWKYS